MSISPLRRVLLLLLFFLALVPLGWGVYAAVTWLRFGNTGAHSTGGSIGAFMPEFDIAEVHRIKVKAPASLTFRAVQELSLQRSGIISAIFRGRELLLRAAPDTLAPLPLLAELRTIGWGVLQETPSREVIFGSVTQPWKADVVFRSLPANAYAAFDSVGYVKIVVAFTVDSLGAAESEFITETRVLATDSLSRAKFRRYWAIFSPGILLIRSEAIKLVRRDAERMNGL
jgi:hypothetical protein